jgi:hypothetical protein
MASASSGSSSGASRKRKRPVDYVERKQEEEDPPCSLCRTEVPCTCSNATACAGKRCMQTQPLLNAIACYVGMRGTARLACANKQFGRAVATLERAWRYFTEEVTRVSRVMRLDMSRRWAHDDMDKYITGPLYLQGEEDRFFAHGYTSGDMRDWTPPTIPQRAFLRALLTLRCDACNVIPVLQADILAKRVTHPPTLVLTKRCETCGHAHCDVCVASGKFLNLEDGIVEHAECRTCVCDECHLPCLKMTCTECKTARFCGDKYCYARDHPTACNRCANARMCRPCKEKRSCADCGQTTCSAHPNPRRCDQCARILCVFHSENSCWDCRSERYDRVAGSSSTTPCHSRDVVELPD